MTRSRPRAQSRGLEWPPASAAMGPTRWREPLVEVWRLMTLSLLTCLAACSSETIGVEVGPTDLVVLARGAGKALRATLLADGNQDLEGDEPVALFVVRGVDLMLLDGAPLPSTLRPTPLVDASRGACPCVAPASRPQVISEGERCPLPAFTEAVYGDPAILDRVSFEWPGVCPCPIPDLGAIAASDDEYFEVGNAERRWGASLDARPSLIVAGPEGIRRIGDPEPIYVGPVGHLTGTPHPVVVPFEGGVMWVREEPSAPAYDQLIEVVRTGARTTRPFPAFRIRDVLDYGRGFLVAGLDAGGTEALVACSDPELSECVPALPADLTTLDREYSEIRKLTPEIIAVIGSSGLVLLENLPPAADIVGTRTEASISDVGAVGVIHASTSASGRFHQFDLVLSPEVRSEPRDVAVSGEYLFACHSETLPSHFARAVLTAARLPGDLFVRPSSLDPARVHQANDSACVGLQPMPDGRVLFAASVRAHACDATGCTTLEAPAPDLLRRGLASFDEGPVGTFVGERFQPLLGDSIISSEISAIVTREGRFVAISSDGSVAEVDGATVTRQRQLSFPGTVYAAAFDRVSDRMWVSGESTSESCRPWLGRLDVDSGDFEPVELPRDRIDPCDAIVQLVEGAPGRLLMASPTELFTIVEGEPRGLNVSFDDPVTSAVEPPPPVCSLRRNGSVLLQDPTTWLDLSGGGGAAFALACGGSVVRVNLLSDPPLAEAVSTASTWELLGREPSFSAIDNTCGAIATLAARVVSPATSGVGVLARVRPAERPARTPAGLLVSEVFVDHTNLSSNQHEWLDSSFPIDLVGGARPLVVFARSAHYSGASGRSWFQGSARVRAAAFGHGGALLGTRRGGLLFVPAP
ncbi:MAG: hypothetical protein HYV07_15310 [Deltaproteobacteria bacterium]|nr:hypothetical protein [Deltaproteobacteria bacterium]